MSSSSDADTTLAARVPAAARVVLEIAQIRSWVTPLRARGVRVESRALAAVANAVPGTFDAVLLDGVLERVEDPAALLERLASSLSAGGAVVASVPNVGHWPVILGLLGKGGEAPVPLLGQEPRRFFTRATLADLFDSAGLAIVEVHEIRRPAPPEWADAVARLAAFPGASPDLDVAEFHLVARRGAA